MIPDSWKVVLGAAVTWLVFAGVVLGIFAEELAEVLPAGTAEAFGAWVLRATAWLGAAVAIIRRVTEVPPSARGVLPRS